MNNTISGNNNHQITNGNNKYNHHDNPIETSINNKARKEVIITGDSMLNNMGYQNRKSLRYYAIQEQQATTLSEKLMF